MVSLEALHRGAAAVGQDAGEPATSAPARAHTQAMSIQFSQQLLRIPAYPGADHYAQEAPSGTALLASNESPYADPLPGVAEAVENAMSSLNRYPVPTNPRLRARLSERYGVSPAQIAIGNGSCDILLAAGEALLEPAAEFVYAWPSFSVYPHLAAASGATARRVPLDSRGNHDLQAMLAEITAATRLLIICNPNNPTGTALPFSDVEDFLSQVPPYVCVIVDEAYCEFSQLGDPDASIDLLDDHPNLMLLRTFSKVHGLCGLRVGYALCGAEAFPQALDQVRQPFFCSAVASEAAIAALGCQDAVLDRVAKTASERLIVDEGLRALGLRPFESQANFCWFELGEHRNEAEIVRGLAQRRVLVRAGSALGSSVPALRVTYGLPEENQRFLSALAELL